LFKFVHCADYTCKIPPQGAIIKVKGEEMKLRFFLPLLMGILACSAPGLAPRPTIEPLIFPTPDLQTVTPINTLDPFAPTLELATLEPGAPTPTPSAATATLSDNPLSEIEISTDKFYYGPGCSPKEVTFTVTVSQPEKVLNVLLFVRVRSQVTGATSPWNTGRTMRSLGAGQYEYPLGLSRIANYQDYAPAWLQYQFVLTDSRAEVVARTQVFTNEITLQRDCP
jgi:hypothetical protein